MLPNCGAFGFLRHVADVCAGWSHIHVNQSVTQKVATARSSETSEQVYHSILFKNPEDRHLNLHALAILIYSAYISWCCCRISASQTPGLFNSLLDRFIAVHVSNWSFDLGYLTDAFPRSYTVVATFYPLFGFWASFLCFTLRNWSSPHPHPLPNFFLSLLLMADSLIIVLS